ncbi:MAG TPA: hypothetical protein VFZ09_43320 [Archangium sp.]|uniref:hypothetical protein n=1 Tax=Archangium sp. TaxID=1872627 RepID=UPI002E3608BB|nr:hypothetical protein [Archangium sp.]HEX5753110.1 hypothetical protein [Archangium sp.]
MDGGTNEICALAGAPRSPWLSVRVLYSNILLAQHLGEMAYEDLCYMPNGGRALPTWERLFAPLVFGACGALKTAPLEFPPSLEETSLRRHIAEWLEELASTVALLRIPLVGCTATFASLPSIALLGAIKKA